MGTTFVAKTTTPATVQSVDIVGCGVLSAAGQGLWPIAAALAASAMPDRSAPGEAGWPPTDLRVVPGFDPAEILGRKGLTRTTRTDQLGMSACGMALTDVGPGADQARTGVVLGTSTGSVEAVLNFLRDTFEQDRPYMVNPSHFPGTLMNSAAGRTAIRHEFTGVNATVSGGPLAAMHALRLAHDHVVTGHAERLLAGGVEELSAPTAWAWHGSNALAPTTPVGEGCAMFVLGSPGGTVVSDRPPLGRLLACEIGFLDPVNGIARVSQRLADCIQAALDRSGVTPADVTVVVPGAAGRRGWAAVEERGIRRALGGPSVPPRMRVDEILGETHAAGVAMHLACVLASWRHPAPGVQPGGIAVLTSVGFDGSVGCLVVAHPHFV